MRNTCTMLFTYTTSLFSFSCTTTFSIIQVTYNLVFCMSFRSLGKKVSLLWIPSATLVFFVSYDHSSFWSPRHIHPIFWSRFPSFFLTIHLLHQFPAGSFSFSSTHSKSDIHLMTFGSPEQEKTADKKKMTYLLGNIVRHEKRTTRRTVSREKSV